jgi:hypothetical protein
VYELTLPTLIRRNWYKTGHSFAPLGVAFSPDGGHFVTGSPDHSVALFKRSSGMNAGLAVVLLLLFTLLTFVLLSMVLIVVKASFAAAGDQGGMAVPEPHHLMLAAGAMQDGIRKLSIRELFNW